MRTTESEWDAIRARITFGADLPPVQNIPNLDVFLRNSRMAFETSKENPVVSGLIRWITNNLNASLDDVVAWYIEDTMSDEREEKALRVVLRDNRRYIGVLRPHPPYVLVGTWGVAEWLNETPLPEREKKASEEKR